MSKHYENYQQESKHLLILLGSVTIIESNSREEGSPVTLLCAPRMQQLYGSATASHMGVLVKCGASQKWSKPLNIFRLCFVTKSKVFSGAWR